MSPASLDIFSVPFGQQQLCVFIAALLFVLMDTVFVFAQRNIYLSVINFSCHTELAGLVPGGEQCEDISGNNYWC